MRLKQKIKFRLPATIIDPHCHGRDWQHRHKTTLNQVIFEAKRGLINVTAFMPNTDPAITEYSRCSTYLDCIQRAQRNHGIRNEQYLFFGATDDNFEACERAAKEKNVIGFKVYPKKNNGKTVTTGNAGISKLSNVLALMELAAANKKVVAVHCDDPEIVEIEGHTTLAETEYVFKMLSLARLIKGLRLTICHVSCMESAEMILQAQKEGVEAAIEIAPHYLWFDSHGTNWHPELGKEYYHCFNNLRGKRHREFLNNLLWEDNPLVFIGSDSACHTVEEKLNGAGGIPSNQEMVAAIVTLAVQAGASEARVAELLSFNAGNFYRIPTGKGTNEHQLELRPDDYRYNQGKVINPWKGTKLYFPIRNR